MKDNKYAILSVFDKTGIVEFGKGLESLGFTLISTSNTYKKLSEAGVKVKKISEVTNFPEIMDGRVKSLHPMIFGGILANRKNKDHMDVLGQHNIPKIDLVCVNLYPFVEVTKKGCDLDTAVENIDIGGPSMVRAAAKNFQNVLIVTDPNDYGKILDSLKNGDLTNDERQKLSVKAFKHTSEYDSYIYKYLEHEKESLNIKDSSYEKLMDLRYGENPHQKASVYKEKDFALASIVYAEKLHGKELSYNNIADGDACLGCLLEFTKYNHACVIVKHANPCGVAVSESSQKEALELAIESDPVSHFGGIVGFNKKIDKSTAEILNKYFHEIIFAPDFDKDALEILKAKKNVRLLKLTNLNTASIDFDIKKVRGGLLMQDSDLDSLDNEEWNVVTKRKPSPEETKKLKFAWRVVKHVKSNAIVLTTDKATVGIGAGQMNRVNSVDISIRQAADKTKQSALSSDAFFPFPDSIELAHKHGITSVIQPGGSIRDKEVIEACDKYNISMVFTGRRHFRH